MKKQLFLLFFLFACAQLSAQRFFYVDSNTSGRDILQQKLVNMKQHVTASALVSDYIIRTTIAAAEGSNTVTLQLDVQDSVTLRSIYQTKEFYSFRAPGIDQQVVLNLAMRTFIEKNLSPLIDCSRADHSDTDHKYLKARKDKT